MAEVAATQAVILYNGNHRTTTRQKTLDDIAAVTRLAGEGLSVREITRQLGLPRVWIAQLLNDGGPAVVYRAELKSDSTEAHQLLADGMGVKAVAQQLGLGKTTVYRAKELRARPS